MHCLCFLTLCCSSVGAAAFLPIFPPWNIWSILLSWQFLLLWLPLLPSLWSSPLLSCLILGLSPAWALDRGPWDAANGFVHVGQGDGNEYLLCPAWPGAMIHSVSCSQTVGIVRVWEALGRRLLLFFPAFKNLYYHFFFLKIPGTSLAREQGGPSAFSSTALSSISQRPPALEYHYKNGDDQVDRWWWWQQ